MGRGLPDRWIMYSPMGNTIEGTRIVAFKVPLKESLNKGLPEKLQFTPSILIDKVPNLGTVIDLTNTTRYYSNEEFLNRGIDHIKIVCIGHGNVPDSTAVRRFFKCMDKHLSSQDKIDKVIGVHCTHGVNRTGYLICLYLMRRMGYSVWDALQAFNSARGHPIERQAYITALTDPNFKKERRGPSATQPGRHGQPGPSTASDNRTTQHQHRRFRGTHRGPGNNAGRHRNVPSRHWRAPRRDTPSSDWRAPRTDVPSGDWRTPRRDGGAHEFQPQQNQQRHRPQYNEGF